MKLEKDIIVKNGKKTVTTVSFPFFLRVNCEKYTKNTFLNYEIYKNMKKHIDKLCL